MECRSSRRGNANLWAWHEKGVRGGRGTRVVIGREKEEKTYINVAVKVLVTNLEQVFYFESDC